jgi:hypothetical protein
VTSTPTSPAPPGPKLADATLEQRARTVLERTKGSVGVAPFNLGQPHASSGYSPFSSVLWRRSSVDEDFFVLAPPKPKLPPNRKTPPPSSDSV